MAQPPLAEEKACEWLEDMDAKSDATTGSACLTDGIDLRLHGTGAHALKALFSVFRSSIQRRSVQPIIVA